MDISKNIVDETQGINKDISYNISSLPDIVKQVINKHIDDFSEREGDTLINIELSTLYEGQRYLDVEIIGRKENSPVGMPIQYLFLVS